MAQELFTNIPTKAEMLLGDIMSGRIGLPDLQRPFVWADANIRDLLDSMMKGYPIGYVMLWQSPEDYDNTSHIGKNEKTYNIPDALVIDGQQRLTALLAAFYDIEVKDKNYQTRNVKISYNPLTKEFAVWTKAYEGNPEWISKVSDVFRAYKDSSISKLRRTFIRNLNESRAKNGLEELTDEEEDLIEENIQHLINLKDYSIPEMSISNKADEEDVANIFVRVNSGGQKLTEKNFIETILSVYDNEVHDKINKFAEDSRTPSKGTSYNQLTTVDPSYLIRVAVGLAFHRSRLKYAYMIMRGKDLKTGVTSIKTREENLTKFREALDKAMDMNNWHGFLNLFPEAGYISSSQIISSNAIVFSYLMYLIGKYEFEVKPTTLRDTMKKWIFMSNLTSFYSGSTETNVQRQLTDIDALSTADEYIDYLENTIKRVLNEDYFNVILPESMVTSSATSPVWNAYLASINVLGTPMLFSNSTLAQYLTIGSSGTKKAIDKHHIFPKDYLADIGIENDRLRNQIANFTYLDYNTNIDIGKEAPDVYALRYKEKLGEETFITSCNQNALPDNFWEMEYTKFLEERRKLMTETIRKAFDKLSGVI